MGGKIPKKREKERKGQGACPGPSVRPFPLARPG
jgi:hypothetical protein